MGGNSAKACGALEEFVISVYDDLERFESMVMLISTGVGTDRDILVSTAYEGGTPEEQEKMVAKSNWQLFKDEAMRKHFASKVVEYLEGFAKSTTETVKKLKKSGQCAFDFDEISDDAAGSIDLFVGCIKKAGELETDYTNIDSMTSAPGRLMGSLMGMYGDEDEEE